MPVNFWASVLSICYPSKLDKLPFDYQIRWSARAKKARIVVTPEKVEVVSPRQISEKHLKLFVHQHKNWIVETCEKFQARVADSSNSLTPIVFQDGAMIPFLGTNYRLTVIASKSKSIQFEFNNEFHVRVPLIWNDQQRSAAIESIFIRWLKSEIKQQVELIVNKHAVVHRIMPRSITVRSQKTRWGSCGAQNDININFRLAFAPYAVLEYVVIHELCHIKHKNHSATFWNFVAQLMPDYRTQRKWLKHNGHTLFKMI